MEEQIRNIGDLSIEEREEVFVEVAGALEGTAREAFVEGNGHFAALSAKMAQAIRVNADELARDDVRNAERILQQAAAMISQFNATHPYRMVSQACTGLLHRSGLWSREDGRAEVPDLRPRYEL